MWRYLMVRWSQGGTMMGNKYFIPIRGVIKGNGASSPTVGSNARGIRRSRPFDLRDSKRLRPCYKNEGKALSSSLRFHFLWTFRLPDSRIFKPFRLPSFFPVNLATSFGKESRGFPFGFAVDLLSEGLSLTRFLSLQLLLQALVQYSDPSNLSTF